MRERDSFLGSGAVMGSSAGEAACGCVHAIGPGRDPPGLEMHCSAATCKAHPPTCLMFCDDNIYGSMKQHYEQPAA